MIRLLPTVLTGLLVLAAVWVAHGAGRRNNDRIVAEAREQIDEVEKSFVQIEEELYDRLQALEPRFPYEPPPEWPLLDCDHDWDEIFSGNGAVLRICSKCKLSVNAHANNLATRWELP